MGKLAKNERIKMRAAWLNSVSYGLFLAGALLPYIQWMGTDTYKSGKWIEFFDQRDWLFSVDFFLIATSFAFCIFCFIGIKI